MTQLNATHLTVAGTSDVKLEFFSKSKLESKKSIKTRNLFLIVF